jgi:hypothetical protein
MFKKILFVLGVFLFLTSFVFYKSIKKGESQALALNDQKSSYAVIVSDIPPCTWGANPPEPVIAENRSGSIVIKVESSKESECESTISLRAPGFDISPSREDQTVSLPAGKEGSISWIISPRKTGVYDLAVSDAVDTKIYGVSVKNIFGLSATQAKIGSFLGSVFGPMLTVPWWWDKLRKKKEIKPDSKESTSG